MIDRDNFREYAMDILEKELRKGNEDIGLMMVIVDDLIVRHEEIIKALYVRRADTEEVERGDAE